MRPARIAYVTTVDLTPRFLLLGEMRALRDAGFEILSVCAPGPWTPDIEREGIRRVPWHKATRSWDPTADVGAVVELVRILQRERVDLVHTHTPKAGVMGRIAARLAGVPCVMNTVHGFYATPDDSLLKQVAVLGTEWVAARFSDREFFVSEDDYLRARRVGIARPPKSVLLHGGADLETFRPEVVSASRRRELRAALGIEQDEVVVGAVGRLVAEKGYRELFAAAREVRHEMSRIRLLVVGDVDPEKPDSLSPEELAAAGEDVVFTGWREDVRDLLALMDVFVLASWREGLPRSAIEAAAMGKPLVLTDIRGCREVARDGVEGFLIPPRDPDRIAEAISTLVGDPGLRERMGAAARARSVERFDERRVCETIVAETRKLLARKGREPRCARLDPLDTSADGRHLAAESPEGT